MGNMGEGRPEVILTLEETLSSAKRECILGALQRAQWKMPVAANLLGITRTALYRCCAQCGVDHRALKSSFGANVLAFTTGEPRLSLHDAQIAAVRALLERVMRLTKGDADMAAGMLDCHRVSVYNRLKKCRLAAASFRPGAPRPPSVVAAIRQTRWDANVEWPFRSAKTASRR